MASQPVLIVGDGVIEIPEELREDPRLQKGAKLRLVSSVELMPVSDKEVRDGSDTWRSLEGILAHTGGDATTWKRENREWELAHDERKFGTKRPTW